MRNKTKDKKAEAASYKAIMASVTNEMAQPRVAESAQVAAVEQSKKGVENRRAFIPEEKPKLTSINAVPVLPPLKESPERYQKHNRVADVQR